MTFSKPGLRFSVDFSLKTDDPLDPDFRHCRIEERDGELLVRTFTGKVPRSQAARKHAKQDVVRWCELNPMRLPTDGRTVVLDLDQIWKPV
jgi:hypothetical protein